MSMISGRWPSRSEVQRPRSPSRSPASERLPAPSQPTAAFPARSCTRTSTAMESRWLMLRPSMLAWLRPWRHGTVSLASKLAAGKLGGAGAHCSGSGNTSKSSFMLTRLLPPTSAGHKSGQVAFGSEACHCARVPVVSRQHDAHSQPSVLRISAQSGGACPSPAKRRCQQVRCPRLSAEPSEQDRCPQRTGVGMVRSRRGGPDPPPSPTGRPVRAWRSDAVAPSQPQPEESCSRSVCTPVLRHTKCE